MALTPDDIENKQFVRVMRGYDPAEVATFLRVVASQMRKEQHTAKLIDDRAEPLDDDVVTLLRAAYEAAQARPRPVPATKARTNGAKTSASTTRRPTARNRPKDGAQQRRPLRAAGR
jgi:DivIVA domain-containing protein